LKKILIGLGILVVLLVVAAIAVPMLVPIETYKRQIVERVEAATGRQFAINGDVSLSVLPRLELEAEDVSLSNPPGAKQAQMLELSKLQMRLALLPLLSGKVALDSFVLVEPVINLEVDKQGRPNWQFGETQAAAEPETPQESGGGMTLQEISLGDVRLVDGRLTYFDARSGATQTVENIDMTVSLPSLDQPLQAEGALTWNAEELTLKATVAEPRKLMKGGTSAVEAAIDSAPVEISYQGTVTNAAPPSLQGRIDLDVPSVREAAAWAGTPITSPGSGLGPLAIAGDVAMEGSKIAFTGATLKLDDMTGKGDLRVDLGGEKPSVVATLDVDAIDLNPYLPPAPEAGQGANQEANQEEPGTTAPGQAGQTASAGWSEEPIDVSALKVANLDFTFHTGGITVREIEIGETRAKANLTNGKLALDLTELALYDGTGTGRVTLDGSGKTPALAAKFALSGLEAAPFLTDAAGFDRIEGTANMAIDVATSGRSQKAMVSALDGTGRVQFLDGAIRGINLAAMVRNVSSAFLNPEARETQKTDFAELAGTYTIADGIVSNKDLFLKSPLLRLEGAGTVSLPERKVDYRVTPKVVASLEGQGGEGQLGGLAVPVLITGPWNNLSFKPDLTGAVTEITKDPEKALEALKNLGKGTTGSDAGTEGSGGQEKPGAKIEDTIRGLLGQ
jgi:AsmA protein